MKSWAEIHVTDFISIVINADTALSPFPWISVNLRRSFREHIKGKYESISRAYQHLTGLILAFTFCQRIVILMQLFK